MFSNNGQIHIPVSGGTPWKQVPEGSQYPSQERWMDGNLYAPVSEVNKPRVSAPIISNTNTSVVQDSRASQRRSEKTTRSLNKQTVRHRRFNTVWNYG